MGSATACGAGDRAGIGSGKVSGALAGVVIGAGRIIETAGAGSESYWLLMYGAVGAEVTPAWSSIFFCVSRAARSCSICFCCSSSCAFNLAISTAVRVAAGLAGDAGGSAAKTGWSSATAAHDNTTVLIFDLIMLPVLCWKESESNEHGFRNNS